MNKLVVIDYGLGNLASVGNALKKLKVPFVVSSNPNDLSDAAAIILPGVGAAGAGMKGLRGRGTDKALIAAARKGTPILGICLGMQLLMSSSEEGNVQCLGLAPGKVKKFQTDLKVPQMGWNEVSATDDSRLLRGITTDSYFYFVHSYFCAPDDSGIATGTTDYNGQFCSVFEQDNISAVQFHPEKSGDAGLQVLRNFWELAC
jgi:imidazole glycerol-phosphate synthase subunit HisH